MSDRSIKLEEDDADGWAKLCGDLAEKCDTLPDAAAEFASSVKEKLVGIGETIEKTGRVSQGQRSAVTNMEKGISKWIR